MSCRLWIIFITAIMLGGAPAVADFQFRITNPRGHRPIPSMPGIGDYGAYCDQFGRVFRPYCDFPPMMPGYYPPGVGPYGMGYPGYYSGGAYPIFPAPRLVAPPVVVPPLIARAVPPPPVILRRVPGGGWIAEPHPNIHLYYVPPYPNFLTGGTAYYPTPTYPLTPRIRVDLYERDERRMRR